MLRKVLVVTSSHLCFVRYLWELELPKLKIERQTNRSTRIVCMNFLFALAERSSDKGDNEVQNEDNEGITWGKMSGAMKACKVGAVRYGVLRITYVRKVVQ